MRQLSQLLLGVKQGRAAAAGAGQTAAGRFLKRRRQLPDIQGFFHIADGLQLDGRFQIFFVGVGAHKDQGGVRKLLQKFFRHLHAVHPRHAHVREHDVRFLPERRLQTVDAVVRQDHAVDGERLQVQAPAYPLPGQLFVVHNQKFHGNLSFPLKSY